MIEPENKPSDPPAKDVGSILKQARLRRGQSFEVAFQHTRIPKKFLEALENNRFDEFPAAVYLRGFLKGYCEHLEVDFEPLWAQIQPPKANVETTKDSKSAEPRAEPPRPLSSLSSSERSWDERSHSFLRLGAAAIVGGLAVIGLFWSLQKRGPKTPQPPPLSQHPPEALAPVVRPLEKLTLKIVFLNEAWVSLRCDDHLRFEGRAPAGLTQTWSAAKEFTLRTSTPGDLSLELDGKRFPLGSAVRDPSGEYLIRRSP